MRYIRSVRRAAFMLKAQVFHFQDQVGTIIAEEYARAAFRYFVAALPIATGLLQHSATVQLIGGGRIEAEVLKDARGNTAPVLDWRGKHWRTRLAYTMPEHAHLVTVRLFVKRSAFDLKRTGLSAKKGRFGLAFKCHRKAFDEPNLVKFLQDTKPGRVYENVDIVKLHAVDIIERSSSMRGELDNFMAEARKKIDKRVSDLKKQS